MSAEATSSTPDAGSLQAIGFRPDAKRPDPLHEQISTTLREVIVGGVWPSHYKLPAEPEFAESLGVSRGTIRRATRTLIDEGLLIQVRGRGTFVTSATIEQSIGQELLSIAEGLTRQGIEFETEVRAAGLVVPDDGIRALLGVPDGTRLFRLERVRRIDGNPVAYLVNLVRVERLPGIETHDFSRETLFGLIEERYGLKIASGRRTFEAQAATPAVAEALDLEPQQPVLYLEQVVYLADGHPIEYSDVWVRGDRLKLSSVLTRP